MHPTSKLIDALSSNSKLSYFTGDAGGQLGLVLGASFITLLEVIDLFVMVVVSWLKSKYGGKSTDVWRVSSIYQSLCWYFLFQSTNRLVVRNSVKISLGRDGGNCSMLGKVPQGRAGDFLFRPVEDCTNARETCKELADGREENKLMVTLFLEMDGVKVTL